MLENVNKKETINYVDSELCVKHNHNNFIPESVYGQSSGTS